MSVLIRVVDTTLPSGYDLLNIGNWTEPNLSKMRHDADFFSTNMEKIIRNNGRGMSLLQHSLMVSNYFMYESDPGLRKALMWYGLMHDVSEILTGDLVRPLKEWLPGSFPIMETDLGVKIMAGCFTKGSWAPRLQPVRINPAVMAAVSKVDKVLGDLETHGIGFMPAGGPIEFRRIFHAIPHAEDLFEFECVSSS